LAIYTEQCWFIYYIIRQQCLNPSVRLTTDEQEAFYHLLKTAR